MISVFFANRKDADPTWVQAAGAQVRDYLHMRATDAGRNNTFKITFGTNDFARRFKNDWDDWADSVVTGVDTMTGKRLYDIVVVPEYAGGFVGAATGRIIQSCLKHNVKAFLVGFDTNEGGTPKLTTWNRIVYCECEDARDFQTGYKVTA